MNLAQKILIYSKNSYYLKSRSLDDALVKRLKLLEKPQIGLQNTLFGQFLTNTLTVPAKW